MNLHKAGKRHPLLFYRRSMDGTWKTSLALGMILVLAQQMTGRILPYAGYIPPLPSLWDDLALIAGFLLILLALLIVIGRGLAYAQARSDHLRIGTPFTQIKVSYRRVRSVHPANIAQLFPPEKLRGSRRSFLEPFFGKTAVVIELNSYPLSQRELRFFLGPYSLLPSDTGLVLLVPDWMSFSTEIDTRLGKWRHT